MKTRGSWRSRMVRVVLIAVTLVVAGGGFFIGGKLRDARARLCRERTELEARLSATEFVISASGRAVIVTGKSEVDLSTPKKRREAAVKNEIEALKADFDSGRLTRLPKRKQAGGQLMYPELLKIPEYAALYRVVERGAVERQYAEFLAKADLPDDTREKVVALLIEKRVVEFGGDPEPWLKDLRFGLELPAYSKKTLAVGSIEAGVKALLKREERELYDRLGLWTPEYGIAKPLLALRTRLSFAGEPLTSEQFERLRSSSLKVVPSFGGPIVGAIGIDGIRMTRGGWPDSLKEEARLVLTPAQFLQLLRLQEESVAREERDWRASQAYGYDD